MSTAEDFCSTVSKPIPLLHIYGSGASGAAFFGGAAWCVGGGFLTPSVFAGALCVVGSLLGGLLLLPPLVILHEAAHWAAFRTFGTKARFMWVMHNGKPVAPSVCGPGKWLWRWQYALVILAPTVVVSGGRQRGGRQRGGRCAYGIFTPFARPDRGGFDIAPDGLRQRLVRFRGRGRFATGFAYRVPR